MQQIKEYNLKLLEVIQETPEVRLYRFRHPDDNEFNFYPGQFMMVSFIDESEIKYARAYSIASSPENKKYIEMGLDKVAKFTARMFELKGGEILKLKGPYGKFYFSPEMKNNLVLIGGGTGITPLMSIARYCTDKELSNKIKLIYSVKTPEHIIYKDEYEKLKHQNKNFDCTITITRPEESQNEWNGRAGRIDLELIKHSVDDVKGSIYFLCGPNEFVKNIIFMLESIGVMKEQIKTDIWGS